jgi:nucleoside-diphosphate kinase
VERTLLLIKPNVVEKGNIEAVISALEEKGLVIREMRMETLSRERAEGFYAVHRGKPFFDVLIEFMTSGPIVEMVLEHENCVEYVRSVIGATDPAKAADGTIRKKFGESVTRNAVHASDSPENAELEITFLFPGTLDIFQGPR